MRWIKFFYYLLLLFYSSARSWGTYSHVFLLFSGSGHDFQALRLIDSEIWTLTLRTSGFLNAIFAHPLRNNLEDWGL